ncbi:6-aminohexanoate hydrolase [Robertmurraya yapensis]|uniref:6-aminohexanoate hydrolase n=2 Tax=Bacillaceae TaxID=186817 RepID=A0A431W1H9_9BACI|nr:6-aminohexanoate hydrolase [Bacillus yapensis]RTR29203.1 6-aminohexanoate hydrolase [Bacillus yapensis]TKS94808.1 6-aminohexanoate hydrolase [Bacillus yapensis]
MIDVLNNWMLESSQNFNIVVGLTMVLYVGSLLVLFYIGKKFGKPDERTNGIYLKISSCMFTTQLIVSAIFISLVDRNIEYFRQFFILFQAIVFIVGAIYAFRLYRKDFKY